MEISYELNFTLKVTLLKPLLILFLAPCQKTDFSVGILEFDERSYIHIKDKKKNGDNVSTYCYNETTNEIDCNRITSSINWQVKGLYL